MAGLAQNENKNILSYVLFTYISLFIFGFVDNSRGPIYPEVLDTFGLTKTLGSWIFTASSLVSFCMAISVPFWLAKMGAIRATKTAMIFHIFSLLFMGLSSLTGEKFWLFIIGSVFLGVAMGIQSVSVNLIISRVSTPYNSSKLFSGLHSMYGAASLAAPLIFGVIFKNGLSWQWALVFMALIPLGHLLYFQKLPPLDLAQTASSNASAPLGLVIKLGVIFSFYVSTEILISSRLVMYLREIGGIEIDLASYALTGFFVLLLGGRLFCSFYAPPFSAINLLRASAAFTLLFFILSLTVHPLFLFLTGASISYFFPYGMDYLKQTYSQAEALIAKVMMFVGAMIATMHFLFGALSDVFGLEKAMLIGPFMLVWVLILLFRVKTAVK